MPSVAKKLLEWKNEDLFNLSVELFTEEFLYDESTEEEGNFSLLDRNIIIEKMDQYGNKRFPPNSDSVKNAKRAILYDENGEIFNPRTDVQFTPFKNIEETLNLIKLRGYKEARLETRMEEIPNDLTKWLKEINWPLMHRRIWLNWLRAPEVKVFIKDKPVGEICAAMYEYFLEASTAEALRKG